MRDTQADINTSIHLIKQGTPEGLKCLCKLLSKHPEVRTTIQIETGNTILHNIILYSNVIENSEMRGLLRDQISLYPKLLVFRNKGGKSSYNLLKERIFSHLADNNHIKQKIKHTIFEGFVSCAKAGKVEMLHSLYQEDPSLITQTDSHGKTALQKAIKKHYPPNVIKYLNDLASNIQNTTNQSYFFYHAFCIREHTHEQKTDLFLRSTQAATPCSVILGL